MSKQTPHFFVMALPAKEDRCANAVYFLREALGVEMYVTDSRKNIFLIAGDADSIANIQSPNGTVEVNLNGEVVELEVSSSILDDLDQLANLEEEVPAQIVAGNINIGDILEEGLSFTDFVKLLLLSTYEPTLISPSYNLSTSITGIREVGSTANITLTGQFNRGLIRGDLVSGSWSPNATQDLRAGAASGYSFDGTSQAGDTISFSHVVTEGQNEFESIVTHQIGPQPLNSEGNNFNFPFPAGTIGDNNVQLVGRYRQFFGSVANFPTTSSAIRSLNSNFSNTDRFTVNINTTRFTIVIPDTKDLADVTTQNNENITGNFLESTISVEDGGGNLVNYKIFNLQTAIPLNVIAGITLS